MHRLLISCFLLACGGTSSGAPPSEQHLRVPFGDASSGAPSSGATLTVSPKTAAVVAGATQRFTAKVSGTIDTRVTWAVREPEGCGTIATNGDYHAPSAPATCHIVARAGDAVGDATAIVSTLTVESGMPHVSIGKPAFASEGNAALLTDGAYRAPYAWTFQPAHCTPQTPCWIAVKIGAGASRLLVDWSHQDGEGDFDTRVWGGATLVDYTMWTSANSTNGADGTWSQAQDVLTNQPATVGANFVIQRSHLISFQGSSWVKLVITSATADSSDELDAWDASATNADTFLFHGDSITHRCANLRGTDPKFGEQPSFQADVQAAHASHFPLQVGAGVISESSTNAIADVATYLSFFRPVKFWFFTMGTNDLCQGADKYAANAQVWIDAVKGAGAVPILVHPIWGNDNASYCSDNGPSFNAAVDALVAKNGLGPAVQLYEATVGHPEYYEAGDVHPNPLGCSVWNKTFADAVSSFYLSEE